MLDPYSSVPKQASEDLITLCIGYFHLNGKPRCVHVRRHLQFWSTLWSWTPSFIHFLKPRRIDTNNEVCYEQTSFQILTKLKVSDVEYMKQNDSLLRSLYFFLPKSDWPFLDHWFSVYLYNVLGSLPYYTMCLKMTIVAELKLYFRLARILWTRTCPAQSPEDIFEIQLQWKNVSAQRNVFLWQLPLPIFIS